MFDLEKSIAQWRQQMLDGGIRSAAVDELECHLREEAQKQIRLGTNDRQAFEVAVQRIGQTRELHNEFKKVGSKSRLLEMMMIGVCAIFLAFVLFLGSAAVVLCYSSLGERVMAATAMLGGLMVACRWRYLVRFLPVIRDTRKRIAVGLACMASGFCAPPFIGDVVLPRSVVDRFPATEFWLFFLLTVLICAGLGLLMNEREREIFGIKKSA